jgi:putative phosphoesterase
VSSVGVISDTHGLLRESALDALRGSALIIHAGDVGGHEILDRLSQLAPVVAVRGNVDRSAWASELPATAVAETIDGLIYVLHDANELDLNPRAADFRAVVSGHSHRPSHKVEHGVHYVNPGSAGPRRFHLPVTVARIHLGETAWTVTFVDVLTGAVLSF